MNPRLRRLQADYEQVREVYSGHPQIEVEPISDRLPPEIYRANYTLKGLALKGDRPGPLEYEKVEVEESNRHIVEIMLPRLYPKEKPYVVPKTPIFHPNVQDYYCLVDDENWAPSTKLVDLIAKIGNIIQYRLYNLGSPLDGLAAHWTRDQESKDRFPIGDVDLGVAEINLESDVNLCVTKEASATVSRATSGSRRIVLSEESGDSDGGIGAKFRNG